MVGLSTILITSGVVTLSICFPAIFAGFGTSGIAAGSAAAGIQSGIGNVAAGSAFSTATSLGMKGVFVKGSVGGATSVAAGLATRSSE
jgi:hypothetical protein